MDKFIGHKRINIDGRHDYMIRVHNTDFDESLMNYLLLIERVEVVEAGEEGLTLKLAVGTVSTEMTT